MNFAHLCRCNNCLSIMWDENPSPAQPKWRVESNVDIRHMTHLDEGGRVCPSCGVNDYIVDVTEIDLTVVRFQPDGYRISDEIGNVYRYIGYSLEHAKKLFRDRFHVKRLAATGVATIAFTVPCDADGNYTEEDALKALQDRVKTILNEGDITEVIGSLDDVNEEP